MNYEISQFIYLRSLVYISGWIEGGCVSLELRRRRAEHDPIVPIAGKWYDSILPKARETREAKANTFALRVDPSPRLDLVDKFGAGAVHWGFEARAALPAHVGPYVEFDLIARGVSGKGETIRLGALMRQRVMDQHARVAAFFAQCKSSEGARVLELGARARSGVVRKQLFGDSAVYTGVDVMAGENVDVVADAHFLSQAVTGPFDFVYSGSVFEHLLMPWKVVVELNKVMAPGGFILTQAPQTWPLHDEPWDFFRYSTHAWKSLFNELTGFEIEYTGASDEAIVAPVHNFGHPIVHLDLQPCYLGSFCIARKTGEARDVDLPRDAYERILGDDKYPL